MNLFKCTGFGKQISTETYSFAVPTTPTSPISNVSDDDEEDDIDYSSTIQQEAAGKNSKYI
jgi:hypothetical protein